MSRFIVMEIEQVINKAVEAVGLQSLELLQRHCNKLVCVTGNDVFVSLPTGFGKSCRGLRAFESSRLVPQALQVPPIGQKKQKVYVCARTRVSIIEHNDIHHSWV
jgi:hypothetical protein